VLIHAQGFDWVDEQNQLIFVCRLLHIKTWWLTSAHAHTHAHTHYTCGRTHTHMLWLPCLPMWSTHWARGVETRAHIQF